MKKGVIVFALVFLVILTPVAYADPFTDWFRGLLGITGKATSGDCKAAARDACGNCNEQSTRFYRGNGPWYFFYYRQHTNSEGQTFSAGDVTIETYDGSYHESGSGSFDCSSASSPPPSNTKKNVGESCTFNDDCLSGNCGISTNGGNICCKDKDAGYCYPDGKRCYPSNSCGNVECGTIDNGCGVSINCGNCDKYGGNKPYCQNGICVAKTTSNPCAGVDCGTKCIGYELRQGSCQNGVCTYNTVLEYNSVACGYTTVANNPPTYISGITTSNSNPAVNTQITVRCNFSDASRASVWLGPMSWTINEQGMQKSGDSFSYTFTIPSNWAGKTIKGTCNGYNNYGDAFGSSTWTSDRNSLINVQGGGCTCLAASEVGCGTSLSINCGTCTGTGTKCSSGSCENGKCVSYSCFAVVFSDKKSCNYDGSGCTTDRTNCIISGSLCDSTGKCGGAVNGACAGLNSCAAGSFSDVADDSNYYKWDCVGLSGGSTAHCSLAKTTGCSASNCGACSEAQCLSVGGCDWNDLTDRNNPKCIPLKRDSCTMSCKISDLLRGNFNCLEGKYSCCELEGGTLVRCEIKEIP